MKKYVFYLVSVLNILLVGSIFAADPLPIINLTATPTTITSGTSTLLSWNSSHATSCTLAQNASGGVSTGTTIPLAGSGRYTPSQTITYGLSCSGLGGTSYISKTVTVVNPLPIVNLTATPTTITSGTSTVLTWNTRYATLCAMSQTASGKTITSYVPLSASIVYKPISSTMYSLYCGGTGGSVFKTIKVSVL